jgi:hypothetical protein
MSRYLKNPQDKQVENRQKKRLDWFTAFNREAMAAGAWIISTPGATEVVVETLPTSAWPAILMERGYKLKEIEPGQRILPFAVATPMTLSSSGGLIPATAGSTKPVTMTHYGAGPVRTVRYSFKTPF